MFILRIFVSISARAVKAVKSVNRPVVIGSANIGIGDKVSLAYHIRKRTGALTQNFS